MAELTALIHLNGMIQINGSEKINLKINTESAAIARRIFQFLKTLYSIHTEVTIKENKRLKKNHNYQLMITQLMGAKKILLDTGILSLSEDNHFDVEMGIDQLIIKKLCCKKAFLRGAFLGSGSVSDPEKTYHLEFVTHYESFAEQLSQLLNYFNLNAKVVMRKGNYVVYLKEGEHIVELFSLIGAHSALLNLENVRIYKDLRNNVNRIVNCETANLGKTVNASYRQIENIEYIRDHIGFYKLPIALREIAELRMNYSEATLKELGEMLTPMVGKSGVNHRLRKLDQMAQDLRIKKGEFKC